ncbi:MAG: cell division protein CrgA [Acidimicrobiia bacterium]|nr:cell division protein CrgA [Acidimicrobiia bacterium]
MPQSKSRTKTNRQASASAKPAALPPSQLWVPTLMFALLGLGVVIIVTNYFGILPGGANNAFLLIGIGEVTAGFIVATMLR